MSNSHDPVRPNSYDNAARFAALDEFPA